jgi:concentrative nucleoside transporter, CNT family
MDPILNLISLFGIFVLCFIAWLTSEDRKNIPWNVIKWGLGMQFVIGFLIFIVPPTRDFFYILNNVFNLILDASEAGGRFLFGPIIVPEANTIQEADIPKMGFIFAFRSLPQVIFFSGLITLFYRMNLIQPVVRVFARVFYKTMGISGAESMAGAANIFVGIESIVSIRPYLEKMTRSEICAILTCCFGSISSTVLGLYSGILKSTFPSITGHLIASSILTIPACFVISKLIVPENGVPLTLGKLPEENEEENKNGYMDALIKGAIDGVQIAIGIASVIIAILGCVAIIETILKEVAKYRGHENTLLHIIGFLFSFISLNNIFGVLFLPLTFLTGVSLNWNELWLASTLIGNRVLQTAIPSFIDLQKYYSQGLLSGRALLIVSYVLCGFAHVASLGIFIGGMTSLVPSRAKDISSVGFKAFWGATLATIMTGCIAGLYDFGSQSILGR